MSAQARAHLADHFEDFGKQAHAARLGMWTFLTSELMLFAALFALYGAYRAEYREVFLRAAEHSKLILGTINTYILIAGSFLVAMSVRATRHGKPRTAAALLAAAALAGVAFLAIKAFEYRAHFAEGLGPGNAYTSTALPERGAIVFFTLYYLMTGLHALHVLGGAVILGWLAVRSWQGVYGPAPHEHIPVELGGMYWHLVDIVWLFLWPMFYLLRV
jgi:cytochrome c oxidase subunit 3